MASTFKRCDTHGLIYQLDSPHSRCSPPHGEHADSNPRLIMARGCPNCVCEVQAEAERDAVERERERRERSHVVASGQSAAQSAEQAALQREFEEQERRHGR